LSVSIGTSSVALETSIPTNFSATTSCTFTSLPCKIQAPRPSKRSGSGRKNRLDALGSPAESSHSMGAADGPAGPVKQQKSIRFNLQ
jgi:hypothetical protein